MNSQRIPKVERGTETTHKRQDMTTRSMTKAEQKIEPDDLDEEFPGDGEVQIAGPKGPIMVFPSMVSERLKRSRDSSAPPQSL